jgi:hypothetical protein
VGRQGSAGSRRKHSMAPPRKGGSMQAPTQPGADAAAFPPLASRAGRSTAQDRAAHALAPSTPSPPQHHSRPSQSQHLPWTRPKRAQTHSFYALLLPSCRPSRTPSSAMCVLSPWAMGVGGDNTHIAGTSPASHPPGGIHQEQCRHLPVVLHVVAVQALRGRGGGGGAIRCTVGCLEWRRVSRRSRWAVHNSCTAPASPLYAGNTPQNSIFHSHTHKTDTDPRTASPHRVMNVDEAPPGACIRRQLQPRLGRHVAPRGGHQRGIAPAAANR